MLYCYAPTTGTLGDHNLPSTITSRCTVTSTFRLGTEDCYGLVKRITRWWDRHSNGKAFYYCYLVTMYGCWALWWGLTFYCNRQYWFRLRCCVAFCVSENHWYVSSSQWDVRYILLQSGLRFLKVIQFMLCSVIQARTRMQFGGVISRSLQVK